MGQLSSLGARTNVARMWHAKHSAVAGRVSKLSAWIKLDATFIAFRNRGREIWALPGLFVPIATLHTLRATRIH